MTVINLLTCLFTAPVMLIRTYLENDFSREVSSTLVFFIGYFNELSRFIIVFISLLRVISVTRHQEVTKSAVRLISIVSNLGAFGLAVFYATRREYDTELLMYKRLLKQHIPSQKPDDTKIASLMMSFFSGILM